VIARILLGVLLVLPACSSSSPSPTALCAGGATSTLTVSVVNDTNEPMNICDATVVATGPATVTLAPGGGSSTNSCDYVGTVSPGSYTVTATASASCKTAGDCFSTASVHQVVQAGCNAIAAIDITPTP